MEVQIVHCLPVLMEQARGLIVCDRHGGRARTLVDQAGQRFCPWCGALYSSASSAIVAQQPAGVAQ